MKLSILVITAREDPGLEWLAEGLIEQQKPGDEIEIIIVDFHQRAAPMPCSPTRFASSAAWSVRASLPPSRRPGRGRTA